MTFIYKIPAGTLCRSRWRRKMLKLLRMRRRRRMSRGSSRSQRGTLIYKPEVGTGRMGRKSHALIKLPEEG